MTHHAARLLQVIYKPYYKQPQLAKHGTYFLDTVTFQIEQCLFKVPRYKFEQESEVFKTMFTLPATDIPEGRDESHPIRLEGITFVEFESFLKALYPLNPRTSMQLTKEQWLSALKLSTMWEFDSTRDHAIVQLTPMLQDPQHALEKLRVGRQHRVAFWIESAYKVLRPGVDLKSKRRIRMEVTGGTEFGVRSSEMIEYKTKVMFNESKRRVRNK